MKRKALSIQRTTALVFFRHLALICVVVFHSGCRESATSTNTPPPDNTPYPIVWTKSALYPSTTVHSLASNSLGMIFAADDAGNIYRSTNIGMDWVQLSLSSPTGAFTSFAFPSSDTILAANNSSGLFRSTNFGDSWEQIGSGLMESTLLSVSLIANKHLLAGSTTGKLFLSTNNGESWILQINLARPIVHISTTPTNATLLSAWSDGLYRFYEESKSVENADAGLGNPYIYCLITDRSGYVYAGTHESGIFRSSNDGTSWQHFGNGPENSAVTSLATLPDGLLFAGTSNGAYTSVDKGLHWTKIDSGLTSLNITSLTATSTTIFAGTDSGLFRAKAPKEPKHSSQNIKE